MNIQNTLTDHNVACEYILHDSGIHEFIFHESSRRTVDEFMGYLDEIAFNVSPEDTVLMVVDISRSGNPPMAYLLSSARSHTKSYPHRISSRIANIYGDARFMSLLDSTTRLLASGKDKVRFFKLENRDQAFKWLIEEE